jgi:hypothetical protein
VVRAARQQAGLKQCDARDSGAHAGHEVIHRERHAECQGLAVREDQLQVTTARRDGRRGERRLSNLAPRKVVRDDRVVGVGVGGDHDRADHKSDQQADDRRLPPCH